MNVALTREARNDLDQIQAWITADSLAAAERQVERLLRDCELLAATSARGRQTRLLDGTPAYRWSSRPYWIYYDLAGAKLIVPRFYHQARRPIER